MSMNRRVIGLFLVLLLLGGVAGYAWAASGEEEGPARFSDASPVPAESPAFPVEPEEPYAEDVAMAPLLPDVAYLRETIGADPFQYSFRRPKGWTSNNLQSGERVFSPPDRMEGGYGMRVKIVNARMTPPEMVEQKLAGLEATEEDVEVIGRSTDSLSVTYRSGENRLRYNTFRWFNEPGVGFATFETSVYGRAVDLDGLVDMLDKVSASITRVGSAS